MVLAICSADVASGWRCDCVRAVHDGKLPNANTFQNEWVRVIVHYPLNKYGAPDARAAPKGADPDIRAYCTNFFSED